MQRHNIDVRNIEAENAFKDIEEIYPDAQRNRYYNYLKTTFYESEDPRERGYIFPSIKEINSASSIEESKYQSHISVRDFELKRSGLLYVIYPVDKERIRKNGLQHQKSIKEKSISVSNLPAVVNDFGPEELFGFNPEEEPETLDIGETVIKRKWRLRHGRK